LESKSAALVAAVFVDFPKNECNSPHKNKLDIVRRVQLLTGRAVYEEFSSWGSRHHCPVEVGSAYVCRALSVIDAARAVCNGLLSVPPSVRVSVPPIDSDMQPV